MWAELSVGSSIAIEPGKWRPIRPAAKRKQPVMRGYESIIALRSKFLVFDKNIPNNNHHHFLVVQYFHHLILFHWGFNIPPLGAVRTGGAGDLFPRIRKDFKEKSSIPRRLRRGLFISPYKYP
jgi:hypothetical protein